MRVSQRYRYNAAECLRASQQARDDFRRKVRLSMALSWLSLARVDEAANAVPRSLENANLGGRSTVRRRRWSVSSAP
jgi:hypothetical protein